MIIVLAVGYRSREPSSSRRRFAALDAAVYAVDATLFARPPGV